MDWILENKRLPKDGELYFVSVCDDSGDSPLYYTELATCIHINAGEYIWINHDEYVYGVYAWQPVEFPKPAPYERR